MALNPLISEVHPNNTSKFSSYPLSKLNRVTNYSCLGKEFYLFIFLCEIYQINNYAVWQLLPFNITVDGTAALYRVQAVAIYWQVTTGYVRCI
jgi:hypothetical protein